MWYWLFRGVFLIILKIFFRFKVEGLENLPQKTNFIIVANHVSFMDPLVVGAAIPKKIYWITYWGLFRISVLRLFFHLTACIPSGHSSNKASELLFQNKNVGMFPEGAISRKGELLDFKRGSAMLAMKTGRPVVPCAVLGTFRALPFGRKFPRFVRIKVKVGQPRYFLKEFDSIIDDVDMQEGLIKIRNSIKEMLNAG